MAAEPNEEPDVISTVDVVCFCLIDCRLHVQLPRRPNAPFAGKLALIGGYIHPQEDADTHAAARRVVQQKVEMPVPYLEQLAVFSGPDRDPRGWSMTVAYISLIPMDRINPKLIKEFYPVDKLPEGIAFDHQTIIHWAVQRIRNKTNYSTLPLLAMPEKFTILQLQLVYEAMMGEKLDRSTFRRKIIDLDVLESTAEMSIPAETGGKPAELFRPAQRTLTLFD